VLKVITDTPNSSGGGSDFLISSYAAYCCCPKHFPITTAAIVVRIRCFIKNDEDRESSAKEKEIYFEFFTILK